MANKIRCVVTVVAVHAAVTNKIRCVVTVAAVHAPVANKINICTAHRMYLITLMACIRPSPTSFSDYELRTNFNFTDG